MRSRTSRTRNTQTVTCQQGMIGCMDSGDNSLRALYKRASWLKGNGI
ncbi:unnamed protein product [Acanthoscelides obtectus]|uniref:Uncharacterized protein n=1 Tax=Acanthoscelides obtectus TaxID=200917 RepID=A0A9P0P493_ACAOB|nr:unnamed protein product [Acanthoscelides obtectus]CAK1640388.1 hypothetical protein AOBTE_LOCUS11691 [Acanthoscelides obtectus]